MAITSNELSEREREILRLVAQGASNKEIALQLSISANTVKVHLRNIFAKIGARSRTEAAMYAVHAGLVARAVMAEEDVEKSEDDGISSLPESAPVIVPVSQAPGERHLWFVAKWPLVLLFVLVFVLGLYVIWSLRQRNNEALAIASAENALRWKSLAPLITPRAGLAAVAYDGFIYAIGGRTSGGATGVVERYDPAKDTWQALAEKPVPVHEISAAVVAGKIYVPGGRSASDQVTDALEIYDPRLDQWTQGAPMPKALSGYSLASFEGMLYLFGGWDGEKYVTDVYQYDPDTATWLEKLPLPSPRGYAGTAVAGRKIFILGGFDGRQPLTDNLTYSPDLDAENASPWDRASPLPAGRYGMGISGMAEIVEIAGGIQEGDDHLLAWTYLPISDTWQAFRISDGSSPLFPGSASLGNFFYILGGQIDHHPSNQNLAYQAIYTVSFPIAR